MRTIPLPILVLFAAAAVVAAVNGCATATDEGVSSVEAVATPAYLELEVEPRSGEAPLEVSLTARLVGQPSDPESLNCPSLAWDFGNDDVMIAQAANCKPGWVQREFVAGYTYRSAGSYDASVRVLAADIDPSGPVQILVRGPTPTAQPLAIVPGPTIIIATSIPRAGTTSPEAPTVTLAPATLIAIAPVEVTVAAPTSAPEAASTEAPDRVEAGSTRAVGPEATEAIRTRVPEPTMRLAATRTSVALRSTRRPPAVAMATEFAVRELSATPTRVRSATPSIAPTDTPVRSPSVTPTRAATLAPSATRTEAPSATAVKADVGTATRTPRDTRTPRYTSTPRASATRTPRPPATTAAAHASSTARPLATTVAARATSTAQSTVSSSPRPTRTPAPTNSERPAATRSSVTIAPRPTKRSAAGDGAARVLPADLYYVTSNDGRLWRLPATGLSPKPVAGVDQPVESYAVSPAGPIAYISGGALRLLVPGSGTRTVAGEGASSPVWSAGGRTLAYSADGVWLYDMASGQQTLAADGGEPLTWSHDGDQLLIRRPDGTPMVARVDDATAVALPIDPVGEAGWLPGRPVAWMVSPGLRMLASSDSYTLSTILDGSVPTTGGFARSDDKFQLLADRGAGPQRHVVDLADPRLEVVADGPPLSIPSGTEFSWAPDGRLGALAGRIGLKLLDPLTGAQAPLVGEPSRDPQWVLSVD